MARANNDLFITISGATGTDIRENAVKSSPIKSFGGGVSRASGPPGTDEHKQAGSPTAMETTVTMYPDDASTELYLACCSGKVIEKVTISMMGKANQPVHERIYNQVVVTGFQDITLVDDAGKTRMAEMVTFTYAEHTRKQVSGTGTGQAGTGWNFVKNKVA